MNITLGPQKYNAAVQIYANHNLLGTLKVTENRLRQFYICNKFLLPPPKKL